MEVRAHPRDEHGGEGAPQEVRAHPKNEKGGRPFSKLGVWTHPPPIFRSIFEINFEIKFDFGHEFEKYAPRANFRSSFRKRRCRGSARFANCTDELPLASLCAKERTVLPRRVCCAWPSAMPVQHARVSEQAQESTSPDKN